MSCQVCGQGRIEEGKLVDHPYRHPYTPMGVDPGSAIQKKQQESPAGKGPPAAPVVGRGLGGDPALRLALINAGVITPVQLMAAEQELEDARTSGKPAVAQAAAGGDAEDRSSEPGYGLGSGVRSGHGGGP